MIKITAEDLSEIKERILVICEDAEEEEKVGEDDYKGVNQQRDVKEEEVQAPQSLQEKEDLKGDFLEGI